MRPAISSPGACVETYPTVYLTVACPGGDVFLELFLFNSGGFEKFLVHGTAILIVALPTKDGGAAFVNATGCQSESAEFFIGRSRLLFAQIPGQFFHCIDLCTHKNLFFMPGMPVRTRPSLGLT